MHAKKKGRVDELAVIGIDIGKDTFHLVGFDRACQLVLRRQIKRLALEIGGADRTVRQAQIKRP